MVKLPIWSTPTFVNGGTHITCSASRGGGSGLGIVLFLTLWQMTHLRRRLLMRERIFSVQQRFLYRDKVWDRPIWWWDAWMWLVSKSTRWDLLDRKKGVVASSGKSEWIILPLVRMTLLSRYKLSCLMVDFTSTLTFTLGLIRCAWIEVQWSNCSCLTNFSKGLDGDWQNSRTLVMILKTRRNELNLVRSMRGGMGWTGLISTVSSFTAMLMLVFSRNSRVRSHEGPCNQLLDFNCF